MKLETERRALLRALTAAAGVVERRVTIPILSHVHLSVDAGSLTIRASDLDIETTDTIAANVSYMGSTTASAQMLLDIVKRLPDGCMISLDADAAKGVLIVKAGRSRFEIATLPADQFPEMASPVYQSTFTLPGAALARLLSKTAFAMSTDETRYYLNGVYMHQSGDMLRAVTTDGHRLAQLDVSLPTGADGMAGVIVPRKTVAEMVKAASGAAGDVTVSVSDTKIRLATDTVSITSKVIDGTFPDYTRVIPERHQSEAVVDGRDLRAAADRVATVTTERTAAVKLSFAGEGITVSTVAGANAASDFVGCDYDGDPLDIGINGKYLAELLGQIDGDARVRLVDAGTPIVFRDTDDAGALYLCMPMRVV